jgi:hypothetical protein
LMAAKREYLYVSSRIRVKFAEIRIDWCPLSTSQS